MTHSPTTTTNRCSRTTENPGSAEVRPEGGPFHALPPPAVGDAGYSGVRGTPRTPEYRTLDSHRRIWHPPTIEITASSFKLRANAPEGRKAISYEQQINEHKTRNPNRPAVGRWNV